MVKIKFVVPARSGSKGIRHKNLLKINGISLVRIALEVASRSVSQFTGASVVLTTDSNDISREANGLKVEIHHRGESASSDSATSAEVIADLKKHGFLDSESLVCYLQPTSPFRKWSDVVQCVRLALETGRNIVSVVEPKYHPLKSMFLQNDDELFLPTGNLPTANRQELPTMVSPNGAVYVFWMKDFLIRGVIPIEGAKAYKMPFWESLDIDSHEDIETARKFGENLEF